MDGLEMLKAVLAAHGDGSDGAQEGVNSDMRVGYAGELPPEPEPVHVISEETMHSTVGGCTVLSLIASIAVYES